MPWPETSRRLTAVGRQVFAAGCRLPAAWAVLLALAFGVASAQRPRHPAVTPAAEREDGQTPAVFRRFAGQVVKVQVIEIRSGAKAVTGSGFFVTRGGHVMTNYHVVSDLVRKPERYRAELIDSAGVTRPVTVIGVDVVHDLAVLASGQPAPGWFTLEPVTIAQGLRLYSLGHPADLGIAIVEGTFNGRLPHTLYPRIHFTGSINPGMSGGPTITLAGRVIGVNVATSGNQQSFLVPVDDASALLRRALGAPRPVDSLMADVGRELLHYQESYLATLFADSVPTVDLGGLRVPTRPAAFFNCWGESDEDETQPYESVHHYCSTDDDVFLSGDESTGIIDFQHDLLTTDALNTFRFHALYTNRFRSLGGDWQLDAEGDDDLTGYRCRTDNVRGGGGVTLKTVFCVRAYKKLPGLYDAVFRLAVLGRPRMGLLSTLTMSGVSFANAQTMVRRYVGAFRWSE